MRRRAFLALAVRHSARLATFEADVTPPPGTPLCYGLVTPVVRVDDPLKARGVILYPDRQKPIVLCSVDWLGIGNSSQDRWKSALARAAGTEPDRVAVHTVHQHDAPGCDFSASELLGVDNVLESTEFSRRALNRAAAAVHDAKPRPLTHVSAGQAPVEHVASNRRILGSDGKVVFVRYTKCRDSKYCDAPEGVIDPMMTSIGFWDGGDRIATLNYYATHPMSHYGDGAVSADFPGIARRAQAGFSVYFTGAAGNIGAGKYNNGAPEVRQALADRLADAMRRARAAEQKHAVDGLGWTTVPVRLPHREGREFSEEAIVSELRDTTKEPKLRANAARYLAWLRLTKLGRTIPVTCLHAGPAHVLHGPGELFVEYQLAARKERGNDIVVMAAYGDYGPMYIGTAKAYDQGGYETGPVSRVSPRTEEILLEAQRNALRGSM
jgi:hypothetical protein